MSKHVIKDSFQDLMSKCLPKDFPIENEFRIGSTFEGSLQKKLKVPKQN
jgi:hypothetical protein